MQIPGTGNAPSNAAKLAYYQAYRAKNKAKFAASAKAYYAKNKAKIAARVKAHYLKNRAKLVAYQAAYRARTARLARTGRSVGRVNR